MSLKKITSLTALLCSIGIIITSIVLYIVPQGRVAYWSDWHLGGLSKTQWTELHINLGFLFLISIFFHIYYNWKPIVHYLENKSRQLKVFTAEFNTALFLMLIFIGGTYFHLPPFQWILDFNESIKDKAAKTLGEPPYGHAELSSLSGFCKKMGFDVEQVVTLLHKAGYSDVNSKSTLNEIARSHHTSPKAVFEIIKNANRMTSAEKPSTSLPATHRPGLGKLTIREFSREYGVQEKFLLKILTSHGITCTEETTIKSCAEQIKISPAELYDFIRENFDTQSLS